MAPIAELKTMRSSHSNASRDATSESNTIPFSAHIRDATWEPLKPVPADGHEMVAKVLLVRR